METKAKPGDLVIAAWADLVDRGVIRFGDDVAQEIQSPAGACAASSGSSGAAGAHTPEGKSQDRASNNTVERIFLVLVAVHIAALVWLLVNTQ